ncbi:hypothetical protein MTR67_034560 [Solanum verrucosum]|uniref:Uncharacterized protein n=1 Tax=Solanum verrucosum TaxID=315347 RepID=A0AAF0U8G8_SOLVR|nr:hypothetical protein MTR67_034560 [Solanum verrucosum]
MPPATTGDEVRTKEVVVTDSEAETDEEQLGVDEGASYEGFTKIQEAMIESAEQISLEDTPMADPSGVSTADVTLDYVLRSKTRTPNCKKEQRKLKEGTKITCVPSPEGKNQVGQRKEQSANRRVVPRCSARPPKVTDLEDAEGQGKKAMELTKGRIAELIGEPDLLH